MEKEIRMLTETVEVREQDEGRPVIQGYALKFNRWSETLGGWFREKILPEALRDADMSNVVALFNHDDNLIVGRTGVNLELEVDEIGLKYTIEPFDTTAGRDLIENVRNGLVSQSSFAMSGVESDWEEGSDGVDQRTITRIGKLWDVSPVVTPAYSDTEVVVGQRSLEQLEEIKNEKREKDLLDLEFEYLKMEE